MSLADEVGAVRRSAGVSRGTHVALVRVEGPGALELLQGASTRSPHLREGRVRHTLFLHDDGSLFADVLVVNLGPSWLVLAEGPDEAALASWLERSSEVDQARHTSVVALGKESAVLELDGPYAWEVAAGLLGPAVLGMPYLTVLQREDIVCLRAGKTGEYGYLLVVPRAKVSEVEAKLLALGEPLALRRVSLEALDLCGLESWHFNMRWLPERSSASPLTPVELQLQWRVEYTREFMGARALRARKSESTRSRATCFTADDAVSPGQPVFLGSLEVGEILVAARSPTLGMTVGAALLLNRVAHPHVILSSMGPDSPITIRTTTASLVHNESLRVQPSPRNAYSSRGERR